MGKSSDRKSAFDLSGDQLSRLLCIGSNDGGQAVQSGQGSTPSVEQGDVSGASEPFLQVEGYEIQEKIAEAGQGQVWRAVQLSTGREVAIKVPKVGSAVSDRARLRFEREIELIARLKHPHIARIYESGIDRGQHYYVMDFINGTRLDEYVRSNGLTQAQILELMRSICRAVQHAHQMGVIHRDLKPSNILVTQEGRPYVVDFGLAKELLQDDHSPLVSMDGETIGTPAYMSPEQALGQADSIDTRTDVYSLGVILFGLLTGELPHDLSGSRQQVLRRIAEGQLRRPRDLCPSMDRDIERLLLKALDHEPEQRYASTRDLATDLGNYLSGRPLIAGPPSVSYRIRKYVGRHRALVSSVVAVTVLISISLIASITMYVRTKMQTQQSEAVRRFLNDSVLTALDPYRRQGGEVTGLSILDSVAAALEGRFSHDPLTEASILYSLGKGYMRSDWQESAIPLLTRALEIRSKQLGDDHLDTIYCRHILGISYSFQGQVNQAEPHLLASVKQLTQQYGPDHFNTLQPRLMLAGNHFKMGECRKAVRMAREVLACVRQERGDTNKPAILAMARIGHYYREKRDYKTAEMWFQEAFAASKQTWKVDHAWKAEAAFNLGRVLLRQGRFPEAEVILQEGYSGLRRVFGDNIGTQDSLVYLIDLYVSWGRYDKTLDLRNELQASQTRWLAARGKGVQSTEWPDSLGSGMRYDAGSGTYTVLAKGMCIWDTFDEFHFVSKALTGDGSIQARLDQVNDVTSWTQAGIMMRAGVEPTSKHVSVLRLPGGVIDFQCRTTERGPAHSRRVCVRDMTLPYWIRLQRQGHRFTAYHSADGSHWKEVHPDDPNDPLPVEVVMDETVHTGLAVSSADTVRPAEARISQVALTGDIATAGPFIDSRDISLMTATAVVNNAGLEATKEPAPVRQRFAGAELTSAEKASLTLHHGMSVGNMTFDDTNNTYTVLGSGRDIWSTSDEFHYAHQECRGDGTIKARIDSIQPTHDWAKAGVMIREATASDSAFAAVFVTASNRIAFQYRSRAGQNTLSLHTDPESLALPYWIQLVRQGHTFKAQHSPDGKQWQDLQGGSAPTPIKSFQPAEAKIEMNQKAHVGLAVCSHAGPTKTAEAKLSHVSLDGDWRLDGPLLWSEDIGFQMIALPKD